MLGWGRSGPDRLAGFEADTQLAQQFGKFGTGRGLYGIFVPNDNHYGTGKPARVVAVQVGINL